MVCLNSKKPAFCSEIVWDCDDSGYTGAASRLTIFEGVDLLTPGAFDAAITGCEAVLHTASPFYVKGGSEEGKGRKTEGR